MKYRKLLFSAAFVMAIGSLFSFKSEKRYPSTAYYKDDSGMCLSGNITPGQICSTTNTGNVCTMQIGGQAANATQLNQFNCIDVYRQVN